MPSITRARRPRRRPRLSLLLPSVLALCVIALLVTGAGAASPPTYVEEVMADSPAGYWRLGEASGTTAADSSTNGNPGIYKNGVVLGVQSPITTNSDTAARFDGGNDLIDVNDPASGALDFGADDFTVEAWVKTSINNEKAIVGKGAGAGSWGVTVTDDSGKAGHVRAFVQLDATTSKQGYSTRKIDDGQWHHVVTRFDRDSGISFYIDGYSSTASAGGPTPTPVDSATPLQIAKAPNRPNLTGDVDDVAVYRSLLPASRIAAHFSASAPDDTAPQVTLDRPANGSSTSDTTPGFEGNGGSAIGDGQNVTVDVHPGTDTSAPPVQTLQAPVVGDGSYTVEASPALAPGTYTAQAKQSDRAANLGQSAPVTFGVEEGGAPAPPAPVVVAAGDIAGCGGTTSGEGQTTALIEGLPNATVLALGDLAYPDGTPQEFNNCYGPNWGRFKDRTKPIPGGHDYNTPGASGYYGYFGAAAGDPSKGYYSYDLGTWHVVALNAGVCPEVSCEEGDEQEQWLRADLAANPSSCTLALMHEPRFSSGAVHGGTTDVQPFWQALYDNGADVVMSGDDHLYERFEPQTPRGQLDFAHGIRQFVAGTGGFYLYDFQPGAEPNSAYRQNTSYGVLKMTLRDGSYSWRFLRGDGNASTDTGNEDCVDAGPPPPPDNTPPDTSIVAGPAGTVTATSATFGFTSELGAAFICKLDGNPLGACNSPKTYTGLADGPHTFQVEAKDGSGNRDPTPATRTWTVDTTSPETSVDSGPPANTLSTSANLTFSSPDSGASFECRLDGGEWAVCSSPQGYADLGVGAHVFEVRAIDATGYVDASPASHSWTVDPPPPPDTTAPETTINAGPTGTVALRDASFSFGASEAGSSFECQLDTGGWAPCGSPNALSNLTDGSHTFEVRATDTAGNTDATPDSRTWTVDLGPPPDTTPPDTSILLGPSGTTTTNAASFSFASSELLSTFRCRLDGGAWSPCISPHGLTGLGDGSHTFEVEATDSSGNTDPSAATRTWTIDTIGPDTTITAGPSGTGTSNAATLSFTANEAGATFQCRLDAGAWAACTSPQSYTNLADGAHTFSVRGVDTRGNVDATPASRTWTVDRTAPQTTVSSGPPSVTSSRSASIGFASSETGSTFECRLDGYTWGDCTSPKAYTNLADGNHTFEVRARDAVGNLDLTPAVRTWRVDATAPGTTITSGPPLVTNAGSATFAFSASEAATFECRYDNGAWGACTTPKTYVGVAYGVHLFEVRAIDAAGNVDASPAQRYWYRQKK